MDQFETKVVQTCISALMLILNRSEKAAYARKNESDQAALRLLLETVTETQQLVKNELNEANLNFTQKECKEMPNLRDCRIRQKTNGTYEIRYRKDGLQKSFSSKRLSEAKEKAKTFFRQLNERLTDGTKTLSEKDYPEKVTGPTFGEYTEQWLQIEKKPYLKDITYKSYVQDIRKHLYPVYENRPLNSISYRELQEFINGYIENDKMRTAKKLKNYLKMIFQSAVSEEILEKSPANRLKNVVYQTKSGTAFTLQEEKEFIENVYKSNCPFKNALMLILYTGIRRDELKSVVFNQDRTWITVKTGKGKKGKETSREIPVSPMLKPYIFDVSDKELATRNEYLSKAVQTLTGRKHHMHDLRHTFISRCQECGINQVVVSRWAGHSRGNNTTDQVYTHFSKEYQEKEIKKFFYKLL